MNADLVNGLIEAVSGLFLLNNCRVLYAHKQARGVSMLSVGFFTLWGFWNLYYYPALNQPFSFYGAVFIVATNALYLGMMLIYCRREAQDVVYLGAGK